MLTGTGVSDLPSEVDDDLPPASGVDQALVASSSRPWWRDPAAWAVLVALLVWARPVTHASGGREAEALTYGLLALIPAVVLVRPWRRLGLIDLLAFAPAAAALVACFVAPTGFDGLDETVAYAYAALMFVLIRGYLAGPSALGRRTRVSIVVVAVLLAGLDQFVASWWAWYGSQDSATQMVGTFYWHNQFAAFMAAAGIFGAAIAARGQGRVRWLGATVAALAVPSLAFAASRSTLALFVLAWIVIALVSLRRPRALLTLVVIPIAGAIAMFALASPVVMTHSQGLSDNVANRDQSAVGNGSARLDYDSIAVQLVGRHPLTGTGFDSFAGASAPLLPERLAQPTIYVHNGVLEAFVDGGVVLGGAVLVVALLPLCVGVRRAWQLRLGRRGDRFDAVSLGAFAAFGLLLAHSLVDDDWTYPTFVVFFAIFAALLTRRRGEDDTAPGAEAATEADTAATPTSTVRRGARILGVVTVAVLVVALPASVRVSVADTPRNALPTWTKAVTLGLPVTHPPQWALGSSACVAGLRQALDSGDRTALSRDLACSESVGAVAPSTQIFRARALMQLGRHAEAQTMADGLAARYGSRIPQILVLRAALPADAGDTATARRQVEALLTDPRITANPQALGYATSMRDALAARS